MVVKTYTIRFSHPFQLSYFQFWLAKQVFVRCNDELKGYKSVAYISIWIIIWNSLCNKFAKRGEVPCTMFLIKTFFLGAWKRPNNAQCLPGKVYISCPQVIYLHSSSEKNQFWTDFHTFLQNLYLCNNFNQKICSKVV